MLECGKLLGDSIVKRYCDTCNIEIGTLKCWTDKQCPFCIKGMVGDFNGKE
jgi:hypothetical protein